jgi:hypothetical protein
MTLRPLVSAIAAAGVLALASTARADGPTVVIRDQEGWDEALASLRDDLHSQGRTLHVGVRLASTDVDCKSYRLELDAAATQAFRVGKCDDASGFTPLVLVDRDALFDKADVPRPRAVAVEAVVTLRGAAVAKGGLRGGSALRCGMAVQPYLDDQAHGRRVMLTPDKYDLRLGESSVTAVPAANGWSLAGSSSATLNVPYQVVDRATGEVVLRQEVTLRCGGASDEPNAFGAAESVEPWLRPLVRKPKVTPPAPASSAEQCRWGRGRKGCKSNPYGFVIGTGVFTGVLVASTATCFTVAAAGQGTPPKLIGLSVGIPSLLGIGLFGALFAMGIETLPAKDPQRSSRSTGPMVSFTPGEGGRGGGYLGWTGTF